MTQRPEQAEVRFCTFGNSNGPKFSTDPNTSKHLVDLNGKVFQV